MEAGSKKNYCHILFEKREVQCVVGEVHNNVRFWNLLKKSSGILYSYFQHCNCCHKEKYEVVSATVMIH